jgi:tRNA threonylcarbamoyladenosine biosynthesis protein TsaE
MEFLSKSEKDTGKIAEDFAINLKSKEDTATVVGLYGDLGAGKTTFMKYLARALGVEEEIKSPTFVIMKFFKILQTSKFEHLIHIDAYRIENDEEMINLGWQKIISDPKNLICIEWPEIIAKIMPEHIVIKFEHVKENQRKISIA